MAKIFNSKFTHLSPVWYDLKRYIYVSLTSSKCLHLFTGFQKKGGDIFRFLFSSSQGNGLVLEGRHNADKGWIEELRTTGNALVVKPTTTPARC